MKAVILDGSREDDNILSNISSIIISELSGAGWDVEPLILRNMKIAYCVGCFNCWVKTPGECRFKDDGAKIARSFIQSDLTIFLTPVTFGGYSSMLKKGLDRIICVISPFFMKINGEVHHQKRYDKYPNVLGIGVLPQPDTLCEQIFTTLIGRNSINMHAPAHKAGVILSSQNPKAMKEDIQSLFSQLGVMQ